MTVGETSGFPADLIDFDTGLASRRVFVDRDIYNRELEKIFARSWLFVGHESQIPKPGDFVLSRMGEESVILNRDQSGKLHVFLNTCRHRGMRVCRYDFGNAREFTCPYHGWLYGADGTLQGVPQFREGYHSELDRSAWGLIEVAKLETYNQTIWATWSSDTPSLGDYLGNARFYLDNFLAPPDGGNGRLEVIGGIQKWITPCNWKFGAENFIGDYYHSISHESADRLVMSPSGKKGRHTHDVVKARTVKVNLSYPEDGHGARSTVVLGDFPYTSLYPENPTVDAYFREAHEKRCRRLGEEARIFGGGGTFFPNMSFSNGRTSIAIWHPNGPEQTEVWRYYLVPEDAPQEVKDVLRHYVIRYQGPSGLTEQDDLENWNMAAAASRGTIARRYPYNYQMGLGHEATSGRYEWLARGGLVTEGITEQNQRGFLRRWVELMQD
jgi:phenylpropionate dioxygenase-like ring-hydroxylating dioxygenase large terminal subunit